MDKFKRKNYMYICITFFVISIYVIFFPVVAKTLNIISPKLTTCVYKSITGNPCPLCGGTRYIAGLKNVFNNPSYLLHPFGFMIFFILFEIFFRFFCFYKIKKDNKSLKNLIVFDIILHFIVFILFVSYEIYFIVYT